VSEAATWVNHASEKIMFENQKKRENMDVKEIST